MAKNPRNKQAETSATDNQSEEDIVSDTDTQAPEAAAEATTAEAPAAPKVTAEEHEENLYAAIVQFASDQDVSVLQGAYREIPTASRGKVQGVAMKRAMTEGNVDMDVLGSVLDAFNNLPAATKSRTAKPSLDEATLNTIRLAGLMVGYETLREEFGAEIHAAASEWFKNGAPEAYQSAILKVAANAAAASAKGGRGGGGNRTTMTEKVADLLARGAITAGATLTGANDATATVEADGSITTNGESFTNPSAAARSHRTKDGKATSTNGWDFWQYEGKPLGDLRKS